MNDLPLVSSCGLSVHWLLAVGGAQRKATETVFRRVRVNLSLTLSCYPRTPLRLEFCR